MIFSLPQHEDGKRREKISLRDFAMKFTMRLH
jgi:hypothetical protein